MELPEDAVGWFSQVDEVEVQWSDDRSKETGKSSRMEIRRQGGMVELVRSGHCPENVHYIDAAIETGKILAMLREDPNYLDLIEGVDPAPASAEMMTLASYVLNRQYDHIDTFEITSVSEEDFAVPFFRIATHGADYTVLGMGRGELATIYLLWRLDQLSNGGVVILEEPETHLAAISQRKLTEALAIISGDKDLTIIMSTHSPGVFESLPAGQVSLISSLPELSVSTGLDSRALASRLGLRRSLRCVAVTEDLFAAQMLEMILRRLDKSLLDCVGISFAADGESAVRTIVNGLRAYRTSGKVPHRIVGILDGDQRATEADVDGFSYLPGLQSPERVLESRLKAWLAGHEKFAFPTDVDAKLRAALVDAQGLDHHDWLICVAEHFNGTAVLLDALANFLFEDSIFVQQAYSLRSFLSSL
ncbi:AAA family ATPase [Pseudarthrobacter sp. H3Y2-7]|uniref:AAA family ATPase n=1 Tax=Pseudarthrobacter naphthalenicus TaxID=3031328 RepID=UPI0023AEB6E1|nr:AAA family ATPase [Pseudarthrobacter sp. H3Y2-7]MDE8669828.1 AAA family ATPase [Pseudarthrobacter sp. H3Y2-7]